MSKQLSTIAIKHVLDNYAERHLKTSLIYQVAKLELQDLLDEIDQKDDQ